MAERYPSRKPLLMFGDGMQARFVSAKAETRDEQGIQVTPILLLPTNNLKQVYGIKDKDLTYRGLALWREYPTNSIKWLNQSPRDAVLLILCNFDRKPSVLTRMMQGMIEWDHERDKIEQTLRATNSYLQDELFHASSIDLEHDKKLAEKLRILRIKKTEDEDKEEEKEGEKE